MEGATPILIGYDGSENARVAIQRAGQLFPGQNAVVLHIWEPAELAAIRYGAIGMSATGADGSANTAVEAAAEHIAREGAKLAREVGLNATPQVARAVLPTWEMIVRIADEVDASLVIVGSRGARGLRSLMLGSVSHQVVHHAQQPVLLVPSPALAEERRKLATPALNPIPAD